MMNIIVPLPDDFAASLGSGVNLSRRALEALVLEEYRAGRVTRSDMQRLLGFADEVGLATFLEHRGIDGSGTSGETAGPVHAAASDIVDQFIAFSATKKLAGVKVSDVIREGRR